MPRETSKLPGPLFFRCRGKVAAPWSHLVDQSTEFLAAGPEQIGGQDGYSNYGRVKQPCAFGQKHLEGEDVDNNRAENEQTDVARQGDGHEDPPKDFTYLDESQVAGRPDRAKKQIRGRSLGWFGTLEEMKEVIEAEDDECKAQEACGDVGNMFHGFLSIEPRLSL
jgi:hypothetical protein